MRLPTALSTAVDTVGRSLVLASPRSFAPAARSCPSWPNSVRSCATSQVNAAHGSSARAEGAARSTGKPKSMKTCGNTETRIAEKSSAARPLSQAMQPRAPRVSGARCAVLRLALSASPAPSRALPRCSSPARTLAEGEWKFAARLLAQLSSQNPCGGRRARAACPRGCPCACRVSPGKRARSDDLRRSARSVS